jgi:hypothetical protein
MIRVTLPKERNDLDLGRFEDSQILSRHPRRSPGERWMAASGAASLPGLRILP